MAGKYHFLPANTAQYGSSFYMPIPGAPTGDIVYVDSVNGTASGPGYTPEEAYTTTALALAACDATNHDCICLQAGHTETLTSAGALTLSKAGIRVFGQGWGRTRPVFNYSSAAAASFDVTAANVTIENVVFRPLGVDAVTAAVNVSAADVQFLNCEFELADSTNQATLGLLTTAAADRLVLDRCRFHGSANAGTTAAVRLVGGNAAMITDCDFIGDYSSGVGAISNITTAATNLIIKRCNIYNRTAGSTKAIVVDGSTTGMVVDCRFQILSGTAPLTAAAMAWLADQYAATIGTASVGL